MERQQKTRVLIAKPGLGGHDRGAKRIAQGLRDAGFEVVFTGLRQTPSQIVQSAVAERVDAVGLSLSEGKRADLFSQVAALLRDRGAEDVVIFGGGSVSREDIPVLTGAGAEAVFLADAPISDMADFLRRRCRSAGD